MCICVGICCLQHLSITCIGIQVKCCYGKFFFYMWHGDSAFLFHMHNVSMLYGGQSVPPWGEQPFVSILTAPGLSSCLQQCMFYQAIPFGKRCAIDCIMPQRGVERLAWILVQVLAQEHNGCITASMESWACCSAIMLMLCYYAYEGVLTMH